MDKKDIESARGLIEKASFITITCHRSPDGDAVGSSLALYNYLKKKDKEVVVIVPNGYPEFLHWIPGHDKVIDFEKNTEAAKGLIAKSDLIFSLDYNHLGRTGDMQSDLENSTADFILIDHHQQPDSYPKVSFSDTSSCSTCQLIYQFIDAMGDENLIDNNVAQGIYTGIMTDSGSFRFPSTTAYTHQIVARLIEKGLDHAAIHRAIYDTSSYSRLKLLGYSLSNNLQLFKEHNTALITLDMKEMEEHNYQAGDTEGLVNYALSIKGVNFAAFIRETSDIIKISFRSKGQFNVNLFSRNHFDGGGHNNAAGAGVSRDFQTVIEEFKSLLPKYKEDLDY